MSDKKVAETLEQIRTFSEKLFASIQDGFSILDRHGVHVEVNPALCQMTGFSKEELIGVGTPHPYWAPEAYGEIERAFQGMLEGEFRDYELTFRCKNGERFPVVVSPSPIEDEDGQIIGYFAAIKNVFKLRRAEETLRAFYDSAPMMMGIVEIREDDLWQVSYNQATADFFGADSTALFEISPRQMGVPRAVVDEWIRNYRSAKETGNPVVFEHDHITPTGSHRLLSHAAFIDNVAGRELFAYIIDDITERKQAEQALQEGKDRYQELADSITDVFFAMDHDLRYTHWNKASEDLTGIPAENALGKALLDVFPDTPWARDAEKVYREVLKTQQPQAFTNETDLNGENYIFEIRASPSRSGLSVLVRDITERTRAREEIRRRVEELAALNYSARKLTQNLDTGRVAEDLVRVCVQTFGACLAWLLYVEPDGSTRSLAHFPLDICYPDQVTIRWDDTPLGRGPTGCAIRKGEPIIFPDLEDAPDYIPWRDSALDQGFVASVAFPLLGCDKAFGVLNLYSDRYDFFTPERVAFFQTFASQAATALENARLFDEVRSKAEQLRELARHMQDAQEKERAWVARELHDEFGQALTALKIDLARLPARIPEVSASLTQHTKEMIDLIDKTIGNVRRIAAGLRPGLLDRLGLAAAIEWQAEEVALHTGLVIDLDLQGGGRDLNPDLATAAFRIFQEALTNVVRHAEAKHVWVTLRMDNGEMMLQVRDDGRGITQQQITNLRSLGLTGMRERTRAWGGNVHLEGKSGRGTTLTLRLPQYNHKEEP